jgi:hypothetical protein
LHCFDLRLKNRLVTIVRACGPNTVNRLFQKSVKALSTSVLPRVLLR